MPSVWAAILARRAKQESGTAHRASPSHVGRQGAFLLGMDGLRTFFLRGYGAKRTFHLFVTDCRLKTSIRYHAGLGAFFSLKALLAFYQVPV